MIRVKLASNYASAAELRDRIERNYVHAANRDDRLSFVEDDDYDFLVVLNDSAELAGTDARKNIGFIQEPSWSRNHRADLASHCREVYRSHLFYHDSDRRHGALPNEIFRRDDGFDKTRKMSFIVSAIGYREPRSTYRFRKQLVHRVLASRLPIDLYGRGWDIRDPRYRGEIPFKRLALRPYEFSIALENTRETSYVTEKFVDCIINQTVPIYLGAPDVGTLYGEGCFIPLSVESTLSQLERILESTQYDSFRTPLLRAKQRYFEEFNLYDRLKRLCLPA